MGLIQSSPEKTGSVARDKAAVHDCKAALGLAPQDPYPLPPAYKGECDELELQLKKSLSFALDPANARVLYDPKSSRKDKVEANQVVRLALHKMQPSVGNTSPSNLSRLPLACRQALVPKLQKHKWGSR